MGKVRVAILGIGNCASSLIQGLFFYSNNQEDTGLMQTDLAGYRIADIVPVAAFDVDKRKVGKDLSEAIFAKPNNTTVFCSNVPKLDVVVKKFPRSHPFALNAIAMTVGVVILGLVSIISGEQWVIPSQANTWISLAYLVLFVTVIGFVLYLFVLRRWTASGTSYGFVMSPLVTVVLAAQLAGEQITVSFLAGAVLVLSGVVVGALLPSKVRDSAG